MTQLDPWRPKMKPRMGVNGHTSVFPGTQFPVWVTGVKDAPAGGMIITIQIGPDHIDEALVLYKGRNEPLMATFERLNNDPS